MTVSLTWGGKAKLQFTVYNAFGQAVQAGAQNGAVQAVAVNAAGVYTIEVRANSGQANYSALVEHY
jgi:hypothetical protein